MSLGIYAPPQPNMGGRDAARSSLYTLPESASLPWFPFISTPLR